MFLKELIEELEKHGPSKVVKLGFSTPHSWRGDYSQLAFVPTKNVTVGEMIRCAKEALGSTYTGWKGGEFTMDEYSSVYLAEHGECGEELGPTLLGFMLRDEVES